MGFGGGPTYGTSWLIDWLIDSLAICDWFTLFLDIYIIFLCLFINPVFDSALWFVVQVRIYSYFANSLYMLYFSYCAWSIWVFIDLLINCHGCFILLVETHFRDLEGCYGPYRTFPISNLTPEPDPVFRRPIFSKTRSHT